MTTRVANIADIVEIVGLKVSNRSAKTPRENDVAPRLTLSLPNPFAVRGRPGALALQLVSSSSRIGSSRTGGAQLTTSRSRSYLPPCPVARAGRRHLPVVTPKSHTRRSVTKIPTFGPRKSVRSTGPVGGMMGALVVNLTCHVRRVAKSATD